MSNVKMKYDKNTALRIRDFLLKQGMTIEGTYGMMANIYSESGFMSNNAQNSYMTKMRMTDESYTAQVDNGQYTLFCTDNVGYGLCQWTSSGRKTGLFDYAKDQKKSISDETMQLNYLMKELTVAYKSTLNFLKTSNDISECAKYVMTKFERPADQSDTAQNKRVSYGIQLYKDLENVKEENKMGYVFKTDLANKSNYGSVRSLSKIQWIVIHYTANDGDTDENNGKYFKNNVVKASAHYFVDDDSVTQSVPDNYVAWAVGDKRWSNYKTTGGAKYYGTVNNTNSLSIEICDDVKDGVVYPSDKTIENVIAFTKEKMKQYNIPQERVIRHFDVSGKNCPAYWSGTEQKEVKWKSEFWSKLGNANSTVTQPPTTTTTATRSYLMKGDKGSGVKTMQENLNYMGYNCGTPDGIFGSNTDAALRKFQKAYKLTVDGKYGAASKKALENAVAQKKETVSKSKYSVNGVDYSLVFNPTYYANKYADLKKTFGTNATRLFNHFLNYGMKELRQASAAFNPVVYKNNNADLQKAFGDDNPSYYKHYIQYGHKEKGRKVI